VALGGLVLAVPRPPPPPNALSSSGRDASCDRPRHGSKCSAVQALAISLDLCTSVALTSYYPLTVEVLSPGGMCHEVKPAWFIFFLRFHI
jgi:hypothetical protein